jgi:murein tripeptide amidase MpaA
MESKGRMVVIFMTAVLLSPMLSGPVQAVDSSFLDFYMSYDQVTEEILLMADEHPDIVSVVSIGLTYEGRDIWAVKVSDNAAEDEDEPEVLITAAHHAKEWPGVEVVMTTLRLLVDSYHASCCDLDEDGLEDTDNDGDGVSDEDPFDGEDNDGDGEVDEDWSEARISWLVDNREIWIIPVLNPDGLEFCRAQVDSGVTDEAELWRKNREPNYQDMGGLSGLTWGVDLNRNYGFHWGELGAQSYGNSAAED